MVINKIKVWLLFSVAGTSNLEPVSPMARDWYIVVKDKFTTGSLDEDVKIDADDGETYDFLRVVRGR